MSELTDKINKVVGNAIFTSNIDKKELLNILLELAENVSQTIPNASATEDGKMTSTDFKKLNALPVFLNNATAVAGGRRVGEWYKSDNGSGDLFIKEVTDAY